MDDIIESVAWCCGGKDCQVQWHQANYWSHADGTYTVDNYADGDHDEVEEADLPTPEEARQSWLDYARHVADTGKDPLHNYTVPRTFKQHERWAFHLASSLGGTVVFVKAKHAGHTISDPALLPDYIKSYLGVKDAGNPRVLDGVTVQDCDRYGVALGKWHSDLIKREVPRSPDAIKKDLRAAARNHLKEI